MSGLAYALAVFGLACLIIIGVSTVAVTVALALRVRWLEERFVALDQAGMEMQVSLRDLQQTTGNANHRIDELYRRTGELASRIESAFASIDAVKNGLRGVELTMAEIEKKISEHEELHGMFADWRVDQGPRLHAAEVRLENLGADLDMLKESSFFRYNDLEMKIRAIQEGNREHDTPKKHVGDLVTDTGVQPADGE